MALWMSLNAARFLRPFPNKRPFHFLGPHADLNVFRALPDLRKLTEPSDYFTKHGNGESNGFGKPMMDDKLNDKMTSLPVASPSYRAPSSSTPSPKSRPNSVKKVRVCSNRSGRTIVKPVRVPIVIDIQNMRQEPPRYTPPPPKPPVQLTMSQRFLILSKDAVRAAFGFVKQKGLTQLRKIERPKLDARKMKKIAVYGTPLVTLLIGYIYGKTR